MAKLKKAQGGFNAKSREMVKSAFDYAKKKKDTYPGTELSPAMKSYYENLIKKKAKEFEQDQQLKQGKIPSGKKGKKVVAKKAKYGAKKSAKKK